ncbi:MAG: acetylxylan esterase, partial [Phycisphaerae bacterium]
MNEPADQIRALDPNVLPPKQREALRTMVPDDLRKRIGAANARSTTQWGKIRSRRDWQRYCDEKRKLLQLSLRLPEDLTKLDVRKSGTIAGEGFRIDKLVYRTRAGLWVTANLYRPAEPTGSMPGILICHSHHAPKEQTELQDMGMTWARAGCLVLVPDMLGHGERRQHPFAASEDFPKPFRVGRQDYYFRYDVGMQLHLAGESLMGWFVWDLYRSVDVLLAQPGVDPQRIIILGAVAGGGDPAAVAAALDGRIKAAVIFNFGGAQPETTYPLPDDAESTFNYAGSGSFESTRNLRRSAGSGFLPWVIVAAIAPRRLVYAHEFSWDKERDPVWKRLERVWQLYGAEDCLAGTCGRGVLSGRPPQASHCTNIGPFHRASIHPLLKRWFGIPVGSEDEYSAPRQRAELACMTPELARELKPKRLCDLLPAIASQRAAVIPARLAAQSRAEGMLTLRAAWIEVLGDIEPGAGAKAEVLKDGGRHSVDAKVERIVLRVEPGISVPMLLLVPHRLGETPTACVVALAQGGKEAFLRLRAEEIAELLAGGLSVCLPDVRGTGESRPEGSRDRWGKITAHSSTELMLGGTTVGARLRDLRCVLRYLATRSDLDVRRIALWGDSLVEANPPDAEFRMPRNVDDRPRRAEPLGGLLALLGGLYEDGVAAVCVRGGLSDFQSVLESQFVYIPHDAVVPGVVTTGDLPHLAAALAPRPLRLEGLLDGLNRRRDE